MERIEALERFVRELYTSNVDTQADLAPWLFEHHVFKVADEANRIASIYGGDPELAEAAGMLHDVADAVMRREDPQHEEKSREIARDLLSRSGFNSDDSKIVVDDALRYHSCRGDERPQSAEGKAVAAADAYVHLTTDFYPHIVGVFRQRGESESDIKAWLSEKIDRDLQKKIVYEDLQNVVRPYYEALRNQFAL